MTAMTYSSRRFFAEKQRMKTDKILDCIVHHAQRRIAEDALKKAVDDCNCNKGTVTKPILQKNLKALANAGIMYEILTPKDDRSYYELSPRGQHLLKEIGVKHVKAIDC